MDLFDHAGQKEQEATAPLAERMRPTTLDDFVGQEHLTGEGRFLRRAITQDQVPSLILWGPPGTGKTTLARVIAQSTGSAFESLSAVLGGVKEIRETVARAQERRRMHRTRTLLFIDEIHRFNKAQQDALLPHVEKGTVTLIGATTENPSFEVNAALLSRCRVVTLRGLEEEELVRVMRRAMESPKGLAGRVQVDEEALNFIAQAAGGDARKALTALEVAAGHAGAHVTREAAEEALQQKTLLYDKGGEEHYNVVSAFIKSMRGSDVDAALYWMTRMLEAGEDPVFLFRRMVIFASEDVGNADPRALGVAVDALHAFQLMGLPEGALPLTQAVTYLALAPKSNAVITAYGAARAAVTQEGALPVPLHLRNAPTQLMKGMGYGGGYKYPHNFEGNYVPEDYLPEALKARRFYTPSSNGFEAQMRQRYEEIQRVLAARPREPGEEG
ncbi:replication-associated recombination protein A [Aggregicoccus sp. 17bor-14]|uniref:replication-associated recombination protein A n=1 Tax=Myxococcaceae TaxID=31 RepID=UPI00129C6E55|nr:MULTISPECIES: replication-associated recombination protein A [Myxococcaceae]MBF5042744.1 replication-associated recombination protein A [Simulacricoccus sp. 17bor-14]MRI88512.1 replication-associated recombination protein A [Aggregicoccus sp. 17bor-14]